MTLNEMDITEEREAECRLCESSNVDLTFIIIGFRGILCPGFNLSPVFFIDRINSRLFTLYNLYEFTLGERKKNNKVGFGWI